MGRNIGRRRCRTKEWQVAEIRTRRRDFLRSSSRFFRRRRRTVGCHFRLRSVRLEPESILKNRRRSSRIYQHTGEGRRWQPLVWRAPQGIVSLGGKQAHAIWKGRRIISKHRMGGAARRQGKHLGRNERW